MLFCALRYLRITEDRFWRMRARTYFSLLQIAIKHEKGEGDNSEESTALPTGTIDNLAGW